MKFDVFSDPLVPMDMACFARQRMFRVEVVRLRNALKKRDESKRKLEEAEKALEEAEKEIKDRVEDLDRYMRSNGER